MKRITLTLLISALLTGCAWTPNVNILGSLQPTPSDRDTYLTILTPIDNDVLVANSVIVAGRVNALDTTFQWRIEEESVIVESGEIEASASSPEVGVFVLDLRKFNLPKGRYTLFIEQRHKLSNQVKLQDSVEFEIN